MEGESLFIRSFCIDAVFVWNWQRTNMHRVVEQCSSGANTKCLRILNRPAFVFFWNRSLVVPILVWRTFHLVLFQLPRGLDHTSHLRNSLGVWKMPNFDIHTNWYLLILTLAQFDDFDTCSFWYWYQLLLVNWFWYLLVQSLRCLLHRLLHWPTCCFCWSGTRGGFLWHDYWPSDKW